MPDYEVTTSFLGTWGPYQRYIITLLCFICVPIGYEFQSINFLLAVPQHQCKIPEDSNLSEDWIQAIIPKWEVGGKIERSSCSRYELDQVKKLSALGIKPSPNGSLSSLKEEGCKDGWTYSKEFYESTVVTEFNLVCSDHWKQSMTSLMFFLGGLCGCLICGAISDRFGRNPVLLGAISIFCISSLALTLSVSWEMFMVFFFMVGAAQITSYITLFVLGSEMLVGSVRILYSTLLLPASELLGRILLCSIAYFIKSWRYLQAPAVFLSVVCLLIYRWVPESPRWLVSRGRTTEAENVIRSAAQKNRAEAPRVIFHSENAGNAERQEAETFSVLALLTNAKTRGITLVLWFIWFSVGLCYYGLSFSVSTLSGNPSTNYILNSVVELLGCFASWVGLLHFPRRPLFISFFLLGSLAVFFIQVVPDSFPPVTLVLVLLGKLCFTAGFGILYTYTGELAPTAIRNTLMASCAMFSRLGSCVAPYLLDLSKLYHPLPWIILGCFALVTALLTFLLPPTFRRPLTEAADQMLGLVLPWRRTSRPLQTDGENATEPEINSSDL